MAERRSPKPKVGGSIPSWPGLNPGVPGRDLRDEIMVFGIYKRGQGKYTRLCSAAGVAIIAALGCLQLYKKLEAGSFGLSPKAALWVATMVPVGLFAVLAALIYWLVNKASIADFMIAAEGEMKKVRWSSRKEIVVSTSIVILVVIALAAFLGLTDIIFELFFSEIIGI